MTILNHYLSKSVIDAINNYVVKFPTGSIAEEQTAIITSVSHPAEAFAKLEVGLTRFY